MLHYPLIVENMKKYKSYNIETGEPSFPPFRRIFILTALLFIARPVVYSYVLGLFGVSVGFFLALSLLLASSFTIGPLLAMLQKPIRKIVPVKVLEQRFAKVVAEVLTFFANTIFCYYFLTFLGFEPTIISLFAAHSAVESLRVFSRLSKAFVKSAP